MTAAPWWRRARARVETSVLLLGLAILIAAGGHAMTRRDLSVVERYHANGQRAERREYRKGREHGIHRAWHANGAPRFVFRYANGVAEGVQEEWYPDGTTYTRFEYAAGHEQGRQQMWTPDGKLRANYVVDGGRRFGLMGSAGCTGMAAVDSVAITVGSRR